MGERNYTIKDASKLLGLEDHTLRYYEDELELSILRNSLGHRYYREYDIKLFEYIIKLKKEGLQLKDIRDAVRGSGQKSEATTSLKTASSNGTIDITDKKNDKVEQFRLMMKETFIQAIDENQEDLKSDLESHINVVVKSDIKEEINKIESLYEEKDKERYKELDKTMRQMQELRKELSVKESKKKEKKSFFKKIFTRKEKEEHIEHEENENSCSL